VLAARSVQNGALTFGWAMIASINTAGHVVLSMAGGTAVAGNGPIAVIRFEVIGHPPADTPLTIGPALLNDGAITCTLSHGSFTVRGLFNISGTVSYCTGGGPVPGVAMSLVGVGTHSGTADGAGAYAFADVPTGSYTLTPNKADGVAEITAYDASLVLQKAAGLISLSANQTLAADVNRNGSVTSMDASYILEASVGLIEPPFPGAGRVWLFVPETRSYALLNANQTGQNFTGILIGDVSGNWSPPPGAPEASFSEVVSLTLPAGRTLPGHSVMLPLRVEQCGQHVYSTDIALQYDPAVLSVSSVTPGNAAAGMAFACNTTQPGLIRAGIAGAQPLLQDGSLMEVTCEVHGSLASPTAVTFQRARINEGNVPASVVNGTVSSVYPGDANLDCRTNVLDLIFIRNRLNAETNTADNWQADVNQDGRINVLDLIYVRNRLNTSCE